MSTLNTITYDTADKATQALEHEDVSAAAQEPLDEELK
jgi:hypothetical protein